MYLYPGDPGYTGDGYDPEYVPDPPPPTTYPPDFITSSLPNGTIAVPYSQPVVAENGTPPYTFAITAGAPPAGLALNAATGVISGTPTASGAFTFIVTVTDTEPLTASVVLTLTVPPLPIITNPSLPVGSVGVPYLAALSGSGGAAPYGFSITAGGLPSGLALATTGGITGTPLIAGTFSVTFQIYDSNDPQGIGSMTFAITIQPASILNPVTTMDAVILMACEDGGLYAIIPGQRHDEDYNGNPVGFLQQWNGVPGPQAGMAQFQLGGATASAKGNGALNVTATDSSGNVTPLSTSRRPMMLSAVETARDFMVTAAPKSERFGMGFNNGGVVDAWFEAHVGILWIRKFFSGRKG